MCPSQSTPGTRNLAHGAINDRVGHSDRGSTAANAENRGQDAGNPLKQVDALPGDSLGISHSSHKVSTMAEAIVEYFHCKAKDGGLWIEIVANGERWAILGPYDTEAERQREHDDMLDMMRSVGAQDLPMRVQ